MRTRWALSTFAIVAGAATMPAYACQLDDPVEFFSGAIIARGEVTAVALVRVENVELIPVTDPAWPKDFPSNWRATFDVERILRGNTKSLRFERQQEGGPGTCDFAPAPKIGDLRVLYIHDENVVYDVDLDMARQVDAMLEKIPPPRVRQ